MFFMAYQGPGHESFSLIKLGGFIFVIIGVLFFEEILAIDGCKIVYKDDEADDAEEKVSLREKQE